jgi:hypothetical protein
MARGKLTMKTDEELSAARPEVVQRQQRKERIRRGLIAAATVTAAAFRVWQAVNERKRSG